MDALQIATKMQEAITALGSEGLLAKDMIENKARGMADYDKAIGIHEAKCTASGMPATLVKGQGKRNASEDLYKKIVAEETLKAHYSRMSQLEAQLNGLQSMNRHLSEL